MSWLFKYGYTFLVASVNGGVHAGPGTGSPTAKLDVGEIIGTTTALPSSTVTVNQFLGVPFAVSPPERFSPPEPVGKFEEPLKTQDRSPACIQQFNYPEERREFTRAVYGGDTEESEDCLYLNVFAPATPEKDKAVLFWIFGGSHEFGHGGHPFYDGSSFAANQDVIVVTANYRTNVFGFSSSPDLPIDSRNAGYLDQRLALDWVQRNIRAFGGDPSRVTIFGESAGGTSVDRLVLSPPDPIPFHAAIAQSGQASVGEAGNPGPESWKFLVEALDCNQVDNVLGCVRDADALKIKDILEHNGLSFAPVTDNKTKIDDPVDRSSHQTVPFMAGSNGQESRISVIGEDDLASTVEAEFPEPRGLARLIADFYAVGTPGTTSDFDSIAQIFTEYYFQCPAAIAAENSTLAGFPTWRYYYNATFPNLSPKDALEKIGAGDLELGAYHSSEIQIIFGTYPKEDATEQQDALSEFMQTAWAQFAKDPASGPGWPSYGTGKKVNPAGLARLGSPDSEELLEMIPQYSVDYRCPLYNSIYRI